MDTAARLVIEPAAPRRGRPRSSRLTLVLPAHGPAAMPTPDELNELARAVATAQDRAAFATLFKHFAPRVKTYLLRAGCPDDLAEDLAQETLVNVWRKADQFDPALARLSTWVFTIARNLRIDHHRRHPHATLGTGPVAGEPDGTLETDETAAGASTAPGAEDSFAVVQRDARVRAALAALAPEQAQLVRLSFFDGQPHAAIARELSLPLGTVKSRIRLAVTHLRRALERFEP